MTRWPRYPDGRNKRVAEMTAAERAAVCAAANARSKMTPQEREQAA